MSFVFVGVYLRSSSADFLFLNRVLAICLLSIARIVANRYLVLASLAFVPLAHAQSTIGPEKLAPRALAAVEAKDFQRAIPPAQERLHALTESYGEHSTEAIGARKDLSELQDDYADVLYASGKYRE